MLTAEKNHQISRCLPPEKLEELLGFAEFLHLRNVRLGELTGGLEDSSVLAGSPLAIQIKMRHE